MRYLCFCDQALVICCSLNEKRLIFRSSLYQIIHTSNNSEIKFSNRLFESNMYTDQESNNKFSVYISQLNLCFVHRNVFKVASSDCV